MAAQRLSKLMAARGLCSRREADQYIERGWVRVDGETVNVLGTKVLPQQRIELDPRAARRQEHKLTVLLNKPVGYVSGQPEPGHTPAVTLIQPENRFASDPAEQRVAAAQLRGLAPAGRLDIDSRGLLVLTADGRIARRLVGPDNGMEKEYRVRIRGDATPARLRALEFGLVLDDRPLQHAKVRRNGPTTLQIILVEGRKRQIRRMCELVDLDVTSLTRLRIGRVLLGRLPPGQWRTLRAGEDF